MMMKPGIRLFMFTSPDQAVTSLIAVCHPWHAPNHPWGAKTLHLVFIELLALPDAGQCIICRSGGRMRYVSLGARVAHCPRFSLPANTGRIHFSMPLV